MFASCIVLLPAEKLMRVLAVAPVKQKQFT